MGYIYIDSSGNVGQYTSIAIDLNNNNVHISYVMDGGGLKYATNASGLWVTSTIDSFGNVGYTSIAIDSNNKVHISYYEPYPKKDLKYATNAFGSWVTTTNVHISYLAIMITPIVTSSMPWELFLLWIVTMMVIPRI